MLSYHNPELVWLKDSVKKIAMIFSKKINNLRIEISQSSSLVKENKSTSLLPGTTGMAKKLSAKDHNQKIVQR
jgi:hypothetical protein